MAFSSAGMRRLNRKLVAANRSFVLVLLFLSFCLLHLTDFGRAISSRLHPTQSKLCEVPLPPSDVSINGQWKRDGALLTITVNNPPPPYYRHFEIEVRDGEDDQLVVNSEVHWDTSVKLELKKSDHPYEIFVHTVVACPNGTELRSNHPFKGSYKTETSKLPKFMNLQEQPANDSRIYLKSPKLHRSYVDLRIFDTLNLRYIRFIAMGGQGEVHLTEDRISKHQYAVKIIENIRNTTSNEFERHALEFFQKHPKPGILRLALSQEDEDFVYLITDFIDGLTVRDLIRLSSQMADWPVRVQVLRPLIAESCQIVDFMHQNGFVHRDLKAGNFFLDMNGHVTIGDLGTCIETSLIKPRVIAGTPPYAVSPEMFLKVPYGNSADYWSIGVMVFEFCFGKLPFEPFNRAMLKSDNQTAIKEIRRRLMSPDIPRHAPQEIRQLLAGLLNSDPHKRLGSPELGGIQSIQQQPLFRDFKWDDLRSPLNEELLVVKWIKIIRQKREKRKQKFAEKIKNSTYNHTNQTFV